MSYKNNKFFHHSSTSAPARQTISTTYTELTNSKLSVPAGLTLSYKYSYYYSTVYDFATGNTGNYDKPYLHCKLQSSTDGSTWADIAGTEHNISGDTYQNRDYYYRAQTTFFILESFSGKYIRQVARAYSTSHEVDLHRARQFDGVDDDEVYFDPSLLVVEI